ncbi:MAG: CvpA family protein [Treponema sp.]|jgi:membrane protein required for colicin V production|nr:CvpA family protein [Treponema sp.]
MTFAVIDIIFAALIVIFTVRCAIKGFISELLSMAAVVLGLLTALFFFHQGGEIVRNKLMPDLKVIPEIIAFIALFLIVFIAVKIVERLLKDIIEGIRLGGADRFLGLVFGIIEGVIVVSLVLFLFTVQPLFDAGPMLQKSLFAEWLLPFVTGSGKAAAPVVEAAFAIRTEGMQGV